jgi:hypothetical protein
VFDSGIYTFVVVSSDEGEVFFEAVKSKAVEYDL